MMIFSPRRRGFTLIELLIAMTIFIIVITLVIKFYMHMVDVKRGLEGKQLLIENSYYMLEKLQVQMKNYSIDYEEYFNRRSVGCDSIPNAALTNFSWNVGLNGHCDLFTAYGSRSPITSLEKNHELYSCSSKDNDGGSLHIVSLDTDVPNGSGCFDASPIYAQKPQSFGQYKKQFTDVRRDVDTITGVVGDDDDQALGRGPDAIRGSTGVQELYLISKDNQKRVFFRRSLVQTGDYNGNGVDELDNEKLYTVQMLKLRSFDVGDDHSGDPASTDGVYDGQIDTWACDVELGFSCTGATLGAPYTSYKLPKTEDDGWVQMFSNVLTIPERNMKIFPTKDPTLAWAEDVVQIHPYVTISFQTKLYGADRIKLMGTGIVDSYTLSLQTTFSMNSLYGE